MGDFTGKTVLVTGSARSQGEAEIRLFAARGASVLICDVLDAEGETLAASLQKEGRAARYLRLDVSREEGWAAAIDLLRGWTGRLDVLVNNAGIINRKLIATTTATEWERLIAINLTGAFLGIRAAVPLMAEGGGGAIVNIASNSAYSGHYDAAYTASKWGLRGLTKSAAMELVGQGIRVNSVSPGLIVTALNAASPHLQPMIGMTPMKRSGTPEEVAELVAFLASGAASFITGEDYVIDGGFTAGAAYRRVASETGILGG